MMRDAFSRRLVQKTTVFGDRSQAEGLNVLERMFGQKKFTAAQAVERAIFKQGTMLAALCALAGCDSRQLDAVRLGRALGKYKKRRHDGRWLDSSIGHGKKTFWWVEAK